MSYNFLMQSTMQVFNRYCIYHMIMSREVRGDVIELGVGTGKNSFHLARVVDDLSLNKRVYACDTFQGLPYTDEGTGIESSLKKGGWFHITLEQFRLEIAKEKLNGVLIPVQGLIEKTLPAQLKDKRFCFAWLDMDLYKPTVLGYKFLEDRISVGGILGFHDYKNKMCPGIVKAVDEEVNKNKFEQIFCKGSSIFFKRVG